MSAFIFLGSELGKKQDAVDLIKKNYSSAEEFVFYTSETSIGKIADTLQSSGLFSESRIVIIKNAELISKKDDVDVLVSCIKKLEKDTVLILLSDENRIAAGLENAVPQTNRQVFYELLEKDKNEWVRQFFKKEGFNIDNDSIAVILELVENNTQALKQECSRLACFLPQEKPITPEEIEKWLAHNREESAFTLFPRIAFGDLSKALESVSVMLAAKESGQSILAGLAWCFRELDKYLALVEKGDVNNYMELKKAGFSSPGKRNDYAAAARRYNTEAVEECLALTAFTDSLLRSPVAVFENIIMDRYILALFKAASQNRQ
ncbi:MAG: DNA polymerase III subunit delta [Treponema sp.]|jgi:DNA polymerase-3 subunit delta|nr:DNA polymerase III subunit delta [Treponema sp.]